MADFLMPKVSQESSQTKIPQKGNKAENKSEKGSFLKSFSKELKEAAEKLLSPGNKEVSSKDGAGKENPALKKTKGDNPLLSLKLLKGQLPEGDLKGEGTKAKQIKTKAPTTKEASLKDLAKVSQKVGTPETQGESPDLEELKAPVVEAGELSPSLDLGIKEKGEHQQGSTLSKESLEPFTVLSKKESDKGKKGKVSIQVEDRRTDKASLVKEGRFPLTGQRVSKSSPQEGQGVSDQGGTSGEKSDSTIELEVDLKLNPQEAQDISSEGSGKKFQAPVTRQAMTTFKEQLDKAGNRQLVDQAKFILKDKGAGEIRLILKPEALGKVRIRLNMQENNIVGKIIVENSSVKQVMEENLNSLNRSFNAAGFNSSLEVEVGGQGSRQQQQGHREQNIFFNQKHLSDMEKQIPEVTGGATHKSGDSLVNLMA